MKHDICFSSTEGMIQEPWFHGQIFCTSSIQILKPKIKNWGVYYLTWIEYHHWKSPHWFCPKAKAASWFAKQHPKQFNNKCPIKVITHFPLYLEFINALPSQRFVTHFEISLEKNLGTVLAVQQPRANPDPTYFCPPTLCWQVQWTHLQIILSGISNTNP